MEFRFLDTVHKNNIDYCSLSTIYIWHQLSKTNIQGIIINLKLSLAHKKNVFLRVQNKEYQKNKALWSL